MQSDSPTDQILPCLTIQNVLILIALSVSSNIKSLCLSIYFWSDCLPHPKREYTFGFTAIPRNTTMSQSTFHDFSSIFTELQKVPTFPRLSIIDIIGFGLLKVLNNQLISCIPKNALHHSQTGSLHHHSHHCITTAPNCSRDLQLQSYQLLIIASDDIRVKKHIKTSFEIYHSHTQDSSLVDLSLWGNFTRV